MADSTPEERLFLIYSTYKAAKDRRPDDLKQAASKKQVDQILKNVDGLHAAYLKAVKAALDGSAPAIEAAYKAAKTAGEDVEKAYKDAKGLAEKIGLVGDALGKIGGLLTALGKV